MATLLMPGEYIPASTSIDIKIVGYGIERRDGHLVAAQPGLYRTSANKQWISVQARRYTPQVGDLVLGVVINKMGDLFKKDPLEKPLSWSVGQASRARILARSAAWRSRTTADTWPQRPSTQLSFSMRRAEDGEFEETNKLEGHQSEVKCVTFAPSDEFLASCSRDKSVWFWQIDKEEDLQVSSILQPHTGDVKSLRWHPSEDILVSCSYDSSIRFYKYDGDDWVTTQLIEDAHEETVWSCSFDGDGKRLVTVGEDKSLQLWERIAPEKWSRAAKYVVESRWPLYTVDWNAVNGLIAVGGGDGIVRFEIWLFW